MTSGCGTETWEEWFPGTVIKRGAARVSALRPRCHPRTASCSISANRSLAQRLARCEAFEKIVEKQVHLQSLDCKWTCLSSFGSRTQARCQPSVAGPMATEGTDQDKPAHRKMGLMHFVPCLSGRTYPLKCVSSWRAQHGRGWFVVQYDDEPGRPDSVSVLKAENFGREWKPLTPKLAKVPGPANRQLSALCYLLSAPCSLLSGSWQLVAGCALLAPRPWLLARRSPLEPLLQLIRHSRLHSLSDTAVCTSVTLTSSSGRRRCGARSQLRRPARRPTSTWPW